MNEVNTGKRIRSGKKWIRNWATGCWWQMMDAAMKCKYSVLKRETSGIAEGKKPNSGFNFVITFEIYLLAFEWLGFKHALTSALYRRMRQNWKNSHFSSHFQLIIWIALPKWVANWWIFKAHAKNSYSYHSGNSYFVCFIAIICYI